MRTAESAWSPGGQRPRLSKPHEFRPGRLQRPAHLSRGRLYEPTIRTGVDHSMLIMREETFGPVIPLTE